MSDFISVHAVTRRYEFNRLQAAIESSSKAALASLLETIQKNAVNNAPIRTKTKGLPPQVAAPGLLKNSICYSVEDGKLEGLNTYGGTYTVDEDNYPTLMTAKFGAHKKPGAVIGFVGTFVIHEDYVDWDDTYSYDVTKKVNTKNGRYEVTEHYEGVIPVTTSEYPYGAWVEFNKQPFLRPALYDALDTQNGKAVMAKVFMRDMNIALESGLSNSHMERIL